MPSAGLGVSRARAYLLLLFFLTGHLLDIVNMTAPIIALPKVVQDLDLVVSEGQWVLNAYNLTSGAFLLTGGRFSAVYGPKALFIFGLMMVGLGSIVNGFAVNGPMLYTIRALQGIGAALSIPASTTMIVLLFPNRAEQDRALSLFAGMGTFGNMGGLVMGSVISEKIGWRWCFWILAMAIMPICLGTYFLSPSPASTKKKRDFYKNMDWAGLFLMTASLLLLVLAVTESNTKGWASKEVLPPLIISVVLLPIFAYVEKIAKDPLIPPWLWTLPTFTPLFFIVLSEYTYNNVIVFQMAKIFQSVWNVSPIEAAIRLMPFGLTGFITAFIVGSLTPYVPTVWLLSGGHAIVLVGAALLAFSGMKDTYWTRVFPGLILSCYGATFALVSSNISILRSPLYKPGINLHESTSLMGAIFHSILSTGTAIGLSIVVYISTRVSGGDMRSLEGYRAGWWFIMGLAGFEALLSAISLWRYQIPPERPHDEQTLSTNTSQNTASEKPSA